MPSYAARAAAALVTFVLGAGLAFYNERPARVPAAAPAHATRPAAVAPEAPAPQTPRPATEFTCRRERLEGLWGALVKDGQLPLEDFEEYGRVASLDCSQYLDAEWVDLDRYGSPEVLIRGKSLTLCSPTGNCPFWIYRKTRGGYELLLAAEGVQTYKFRRAITGAYPDLQTTMHGSAFDGDLSVYKFDGRRYQLRECGSYSYRFHDHAGRVRERDQPLITLGPCDASEYE